MLCRGEPRVETVPVGEDAESVVDRHDVRPWVATEDPHPAAGRTDVVEEQADGRRLPGTVGAEETEHLPAVDDEVEGVDDGGLPVPLREALGADGGRAHTTSPRTNRERATASGTTSHARRTTSPSDSWRYHGTAPDGNVASTTNAFVETFGRSCVRT